MSNPYETDQIEQVVDNEEDSLDSGNRKLGIITGAVVLLIGAAIAFGPAANRERIANGQMPSFELMGASVVGSREAEAPAAAEAVPVAEVQAEAKPVATKADAPAAKPRKVAAVETLTPTATSSVAASAPAPAPAAATEAAPAAEEAAPPRMATLSGRVLNENGRPLAGATVFVKGSRKFASTDQNGNYSLEVPAGDNTLVYGYGGYEDQELRARSGQSQNVTLIPRETTARRRK